MSYGVGRFLYLHHHRLNFVQPRFCPLMFPLTRIEYLTSSSWSFSSFPAYLIVTPFGKNLLTPSFCFASFLSFQKPYTSELVTIALTESTGGSGFVEEGERPRRESRGAKALHEEQMALVVESRMSEERRMSENDSRGFCQGLIKRQYWKRLKRKTHRFFRIYQVNSMQC